MGEPVGEKYFFGEIVYTREVFRGCECRSVDCVVMSQDEQGVILLIPNQYVNAGPNWTMYAEDPQRTIIRTGRSYSMEELLVFPFEPVRKKAKRLINNVPDQASA